MTSSVRRCVGLVAALALTAGCAASASGHARGGEGGEGGGGAATATAPSIGGLTGSAAQQVLTAFDTRDSAASSRGDLAALATTETGTALATSTASVYANRSTGRTQPAYRHVRPSFALADPAARCFLVAATISSTGDEIGHPDFSQFVLGPDARWRLSDNVLVPSSGQALAQALQPSAEAPQKLVPAARLAAVAAELFARSVAGAPHPSTLAHSALLDDQFAAGWTIYRQEMSSYGMTVTRAESGAAQWSRCAGRSGGTTLAFVTLRVTDTIRGTRKAYLPAASPDVVGVGRRTPVTGSVITVHRLDEYLVAIPSTGPATLLGLSDAPLSITATP